MNKHIVAAVLYFAGNLALPSSLIIAVSFQYCIKRRIMIKYNFNIPLLALVVLFLMASCKTPQGVVDNKKPEKVSRNLAAGVMTTYQNTITSQDLKTHLYTIASDDFEGRNTASRGLKRAADYISDFYYNNGLVGPIQQKANSYLQTIDFYEKNTDQGKISKGEVVLQHDQDFFAINSKSTDRKVDLVFGGYGVQLEGYDDFADLDLQGKALLIIGGEPKYSSGERMFDIPQESFIPIDKFAEYGITDLFITLPSVAMWSLQAPFLGGMTKSFEPVYTMDEPPGTKDLSFNRMFISPAKAAELFGVSTDSFFQKIEQNLDEKKVLGGLFTAEDIHIKLVVAEREVVSDNVLGYLEGTDLKDQVIIISSHYDHVGVTDGEVYNGADDDGSGTVAVMEIAQAFAEAAKAGYRPRRSLLFLNVTGEEKGLLGSAYYTDHAPVFPLSNTIANLNIDMIGRVDQKHERDTNYVYIIGSDMLSTELHTVHENVAKTHFPELKLDYTYNGKEHPDRFYYRSDHYNFAKNNIPVIFYFTGTHADYHKPTDTPDKIRYELLARRAQLIFATAWELANRDGKPVVDKAEIMD